MVLLRITEHPYDGSYKLVFGDMVEVFCELVGTRKSKAYFKKHNGSSYYVEEIDLQVLVDEYNTVAPFVAGIFTFEVVDQEVTCTFTGNILDKYIGDDKFKNEIEFARWLIDNIAYWHSEVGKEHFIQLSFYRRRTDYDGDTVYVLPQLEGHHDRNNKKAYVSNGTNKKD